MEDEDRPASVSALNPSSRDDAASRLSTESLERYSRDELDHRIALLEAEIARVKAHAKAAAAHRLAAEQLFGGKSS